MNEKLLQINAFLQTVAAGRGGTLSPDESAAIAYWYEDLLNRVQAIQHVHGGDANMAWDFEINEPVFALTQQGFDKADPVLREKALRDDVVN